MASPLDEQLDQNTPKAAPAALAIEDGYRAVRDNIDISKGQKHFDEFSEYTLYCPIYVNDALNAQILQQWI